MRSPPGPPGPVLFGGGPVSAASQRRRRERRPVRLTRTLRLLRHHQRIADERRLDALLDDAERDALLAERVGMGDDTN